MQGNRDKMIKKENCWEFKKCGREPGGEKACEYGVCPATIYSKADKVNGGKNGGRLCYAIVGSLCNNKIKDTFFNKFRNCLLCDFYFKVCKEEIINSISNNFKKGR